MMEEYRGLAFFFLLGLIALSEEHNYAEVMHDESPLNEEDAFETENILERLPRTRVESSEDCLTELPIFSQRSLIHNLCENMCDGVYSLGCVPDYIACSGGMTHTMQCPEGLVLDPETKKCQYREFVKECHQLEVTVTSTGGTTVSPTNGAESSMATVPSAGSTVAAPPSEMPYPVPSSTVAHSTLSTTPSTSAEEDYTLASSTSVSPTRSTAVYSTTVRSTLSTTLGVSSEEPYTVASSTSVPSTRSTAAAPPSETSYPVPSSTTAQSTLSTAPSTSAEEDYTLTSSVSVPSTRSTAAYSTTARSTLSTTLGASSEEPYTVASSTSAPSTESIAAAPPFETPYPVPSSTTAQSTSSSTPSTSAEQDYTSAPTTVPSSKRPKIRPSTVSTTPCPLCSTSTAAAPTMKTRPVIPTVKTTIPPTNCPTSPAITTPCPAEPCPKAPTKAPAPCPLVSPTTKRPMKTTMMTPTRVTRLPEKPPNFEISFTCESKEDGLYAVECSSIIIACFEGAMAILPCPAGMRFEPILGRFLHKSKRNACQMTNVSPRPENETVIIENANVTALDNGTESLFENENMTMSDNVTSLNETELTNTTGIEVTMPPKDKELTVCRSLANGICNFGCSSEAVACAFGQVIFLIRCSMGSKFDMSSLSCKEESFVSACSSNTTLSPLTNDTSMNTTEETSLETPETNLCEGLANGMYAKGCSEEFVSCEQGNATLMYCSEGEAYDTDSQSCKPKESVKLCGGAIPESDVCRNCTTAGGMAFSCDGLPDGYYDLGCNTEFIACVAERAIPMQCPANLKYDSISDKCLATCDVEACRNVSKEECAAEVTSTESPSINATIVCNENVNGANETIVLFVSEAGFVEQNPPGGPEPVVGGDFVCDSLGNGTFACGCSSRFIACLQGKAFSVECPSNLKFDSETNRCLEERLVSDCSESNSTSETQNNTAETSGNNTSASGFSCEGVPDGAYAIGCSSHFILCVSDNAFDMYCPSQTLKFDEEAQECLSACVVPACLSGNGTVENGQVISNETTEGPQPEGVPTVQTTASSGAPSSQSPPSSTSGQQETQGPTVAPSEQPTNESTAAPSEQPTNESTAAPSEQPTNQSTPIGELEPEGEQPSSNTTIGEQEQGSAPEEGASVNSTVAEGSLPSNSTVGGEVETVLSEGASSNSTAEAGQSPSNATVES